MFNLYFKVLFLNERHKTSKEGGTVFYVINESLKKGEVFLNQSNADER